MLSIFIFNEELHNLRRNIGFVINIFKSYWLALSIIFIVTLIWAFDLSFRKYILKEILDTIVAYEGQQVLTPLLLPALTYLLMALIVTTSFRFYGYFVDIYLVPFVKQRIADNAFNHLLKLSYSFHLHHTGGIITHKINNLMDSTVQLVRIAIERFFGYSLALCIAIYVLSTASIEFAIATSIWIFFFAIISFLSFRVLGNLSNSAANASSKVTANLADNLNNIISLQLFTLQKYTRLKFFHLCRDKAIAERKLHRAYFYMWFIYGYSFDLLQAVSLYFLVTNYSLGDIVVGDIALVIGINTSIVDFMNRLTTELALFSDHYGRINDALNYISIEPEIKDCKNPHNITNVQGFLSFKAVSFSYPNKDILFRELSLEIAPKEKIGLVGYSGSGKTTFTHLILRLFDIYSGEILIDNNNIKHVTQDSLRQNISIVPQELILFHDTILENIRCGNINANSEEIIQAAIFAGIHNYISDLPMGYNTVVGEKGLKLSGGERQRVLIARAFLKNAPILILDEATNQLDSLTEKEIQATLFKLMEDKTTIVIAHRLSTLQHMTRILVFDKGQVVQEGSHYELIKQQGLYQNLWNSQKMDVLVY
ncbi:MAG: abcT3 [Rickettsiaceae bacterium]|jgi:ATP-binding cassette subfamily B protein|nr:abcT3 [Rickettsiaceae bacterium]